MTERTTPGAGKGEAQRRGPIDADRIDLPPERTPASQAFPWASRLPIGWGSAPALPRPPRNPPPRARKRPVE